MGKVVGIRFKPAGKIYDFHCGHFVLKINDKVIVSTEQGLGFGVVVRAPEPILEKKPKSPLKKVFRLATNDDVIKVELNRDLEKKAKEYCKNCIDELSLQMNLFTVETTFGASKLTFFFTAEGRVDFRQLVKMLVKAFRVRIEMKQVGIRNQAKMCGGIGRCGRGICCSSFIEKFDPVSIRMAKEQELSLNPSKISGLCGRLMCCLTFENDTYKSIKKKFPKIGTLVSTPKGDGKVIGHNAIKNLISVNLKEGAVTDIETDKVQEKQKD